MKLIKPSYKIIYADKIQLESIETAGRTCYKSENSAEDEEIRNKFIKTRIKQGHESIIEHSLMTVLFVCDRGVSHELVRHRLASFSQESTRYCNYKGQVTFIIPPWVDVEEGVYDTWPRAETEVERMWISLIGLAEIHYRNMLDLGLTPEQARSVLPNSTKTEIIVSANLREWRHIFKLRVLGTTGKPHPQMKELMLPLLKEAAEIYPAIFGDLINDTIIN